MLNGKRYAKINVKVLIILILIVAAIVISLFAAHRIRKSFLSKMYLVAGEKAYEDKDWSTAYENYKEYLSRNPDDLEILRKYAKARFSIRPLDGDAIAGVISAYRRIIQLNPLDETAYDKLAMLYKNIGNFEELAYIARTRLEKVPDDKKAPLWLVEALINLNRVNDAREALLKFLEDNRILSEQHPEYIQACFYMSNILMNRDDGTAPNVIEALEWLNKAVDYAPESADALVNRARFYCQTSIIPSLNQSDRLAAASKDLETADTLGIENPEMLFVAAAQWLLLGELDKVSAEIQAIDNLSQETIEEYFFDSKILTIARFSLACELALRRDEIEEAVSLADEVLKVLTERGYRMQVLPSAIGIYITSGKVKEARSCLNEYLESLHQFGETPESNLRSSYLQALVALAEEKPYEVIDILQPVVVSNASQPEFWRLLADAYSRTGQHRRAISAILEFMAFYPRDPQMSLQLAKEYFAIKDWERTLEIAQLAESFDPDNITPKLLRIEADIHLATMQPDSIDTSKLENLSKELQELRLEYPDDVNIRMLQVVILMSLGQSDRVESELKQAIEDCDEPLIAEIRLASYYYQVNRLTEAINLYKVVCERHSEVAEPWLSLSELYVAEKDYDSALNVLKDGLNIVTEQQQQRLLSIKLALLEILNGDRTDGIDILTKLAAQDERDIPVRLLLLGIREIIEDPVTAEKLITELRKAEGQMGFWWRLHQASLLLSSNDWRTKQKDITDLLQYCIDSDPQWSSPVLLMANMYEKLGDFKSFEETCQKAIARNPSARDVADRLLLFLEEQGRFADAEKIIEKVKADSKVANTWQVRMAIRTGDFTRAINELELRVSNDDRDVASRIQLARLVYQQTKDAEQAFAYLNEAEAITSGSLVVTETKASILKAEGRGSEALNVINNYVNDNNDFNAYWMRALYLTGEGEYEQAESDYKKLVTFTQAGANGYGLLCNFYLNRGKTNEALATIEDGIKKYPEDLSLKRVLMKLLFSPGPMQDRSRAMEILTLLEETLPGDVELMKYRVAELLENPTLQSIQIAKGLLEDIIDLQPTAINEYLMLINLEMQEGNFQAARDFANRALGSNQNALELISARARAEFALGETQLAVELSRMVLQQDIRNNEALNVAIQSNNSDFLEDVLLLIESKLDAVPADEQLLLSRARVLASLGTPQKAIPELEAYCQTEKGSNSLAAFLTLADLYRLSDEMEKAGDWIKRAEQIEPYNLSVIHKRFLWLLAQDKVDELAQISSAYFSAEPQNATTFVAAASILAASDSMKLVEEGLKLFERAAALSPMFLEAKLGMASCLYRTGNVTRAEEIYKQLLEQYPDNIRILNDLAWILQEHNQEYDDALDLINRGLILVPNDIHMLDTRGTILMKLERFSDAKSDFEKLIVLVPSDTPVKAKALLKLGRICVKLDDLVNAKIYLEQALEINKKLSILDDDELSEIEKILQMN